MVYQELGLIPNLLLAPGWSHVPAVYQAMNIAGREINGHWHAMTLADIPVDDGSATVDSIARAKDWKAENDYNNERSKVCWPMGKDADGNVYHLSTHTAWNMLQVDAAHNGLPMESPSNKAAFIVKQHFGSKSKNRGFDQVEANELNADGITTAVYFGGRWVLWGPHTAAYKHGSVDDPRVIFDSSIRMMMYTLNDFQRDWAQYIDQPMTRALKDTIENRQQEKADARAAMGAFIGKPVVRFSATNTEAGMMDGNFVWDFEGTPTPPWKSGTLRVAYTDAGFSAYKQEVN